MATPNEVVEEREIVCYCRKKVAQRVVPIPVATEHLIVIEGRGMTLARCIVVKP
jgi:hypothetical protein